MAKEECIEQWNKTGASSTVRNRKTCPISEKTPSAHPPKDKNIHSFNADDRSSNGTSARGSPKGDSSHERPSWVLLMLLVGLSFSTRLYKISEPPHVWWVDLLCRVSDDWWYQIVFSMPWYPGKGLWLPARHPFARTRLSSPVYQLLPLLLHANSEKTSS